MFQKLKKKNKKKSKKGQKFARIIVKRKKEKMAGNGMREYNKRMVI